MQTERRKILVTGASGFVGKHLVPSLLQEGWEVIVFLKTGDDEKFFRELGVSHIYWGDLSSEKNDLETIFKLHNFDAVAHLAALIKAPWDAFYKVNILATKKLIALAELQPRLQHFIFISTDFVLSQMQNDYRESKYQAEEALRASRLPYTILRPSPIYGPGDNKNLDVLLRMIKKLPVLPAPTFTMYPIYVLDVVHAICKMLNSETVNRKEYNLPGGTVMTFRAMLEIMRDSISSKCVLFPVQNRLFTFAVWIQERLLRTPILNYYQVAKWASNEPYEPKEAKRDFNFTQTPFEVGIKETARAARESI